ncbi:menaquinone biosynthesis family protein [Deinococcus lacus]|uniref:1,4-dihydroxy-6-naphtoate synthase n=1 Tax=Deinococcus lacus TaxID=392561 RepID=A0ABW1YBT9_9DEIO
MTVAPHTLELGYSPCPNDTFIFYALQAGLVPAPAPVHEVLAGVQTLNEWAAAGRLPLTKISYRAAFEVLDHYALLRAGGALGRGAGPLVVARRPLEDLSGLRVASPGRLTTAELLLRLAWPQAVPVPVPFREVMAAVERGEYGGQPLDAGLIIHESRFTYPQHGLVAVRDMGSWWEQETGLPLPLGAILVRRDLPADVQRAAEQAIRDSVAYAWAHQAEALAYVRQHAGEDDETVVRGHIDLYVNEYSLDLGDTGERAVQELYRRGVEAGALRAGASALFLP